jgi:hypothetical protein
MLRPSGPFTTTKERGSAAVLHVLLIAVVAWFIWTWYRGKSKRRNSAAEARLYGSERVAAIQAAFDKEIVERNVLPDAVRNRYAYIYRNLMRDWYAQISAACRGDTDKLQSVNADWLGYIDGLKEQGSVNFSAMVANDEMESSRLGQRLRTIRLRLSAIEDSFAAQLGTSETAELKRIREIPNDRFNRSGTEIAA